MISPSEFLTLKPLPDESPPILPVEERVPRGDKWLVRLVIGGAAIAGALLLFFFPPESHGFYPRCMLYQMTGWQCPGCGGLRAAHHLLHGDIATAFHYNAFLVLMLPYGLLWTVAPAFKSETGLGWLDFTRRSRSVIFLLIIALVYGVSRNLVH